MKGRWNSVPLEIKNTGKDDLSNIAALWNDGDVMKFVGFPKGLGVTPAKLESWLDKINEDPYTGHYSIYDKNIGYCGETFYSADATHRIAALDIKLLKKARGRGIAAEALSHSIDKAFSTGVVDRVYVDPDPKNKKAIALYRKLGFEEASRPAFLEPSKTHYELDYDTFYSMRLRKKG